MQPIQNYDAKWEVIYLLRDSTWISHHSRLQAGYKYTTYEQIEKREKGKSKSDSVGSTTRER